MHPIQGAHIDIAPAIQPHSVGEPWPDHPKRRTCDQGVAILSDSIGVNCARETRKVGTIRLKGTTSNDIAGLFRRRKSNVIGLIKAKSDRRKLLGFRVRTINIIRKLRLLTWKLQGSIRQVRKPDAATSLDNKVIRTIEPEPLVVVDQSIDLTGNIREVRSKASSDRDPLTRLLCPEHLSLQIDRLTIHPTSGNAIETGSLLGRSNHSARPIQAVPLQGIDTVVNDVAKEKQTTTAFSIIQKTGSSEKPNPLAKWSNLGVRRMIASKEGSYAWTDNCGDADSGVNG